MTPLLRVRDAEIAVPRGPLLFSCGGLELLPGQFACLLGPNGAGKSTFLRTVSGLVPPRKGRVFLGDTSLDSLPVGLRGHHLSALFAASPLSPLVSVYDLVALGRYPYTGRRGRLSSNDREVVEEELTRLDLSGLRHRPIGRLSDGERRRAHLARGLAQRAPLLVLDEALAFLDARWKQRILADLKRRCLGGMGVVLATQDIPEALDTADTLWLIDRPAKTLHTGGPEDVALEGIVGRVFSEASYRFDPTTNRFEAVETADFGYRLSGDPEAVAWTRRGLRRIGGREVASGDEGLPFVAVSVNGHPGRAGESRYRWRFEVQFRRAAPVEDATTLSGEASSISELVEALKRLRRDR
ncbi:MAG: ABC transporter ATP-binding protein [Spirochaetaceae bacterium]